MPTTASLPLENGPDTCSAPGILTRDCGTTRWEVQADEEEQLLDTAGLRWARWRETGRLEVVKTGPHRSVYRVDLPEGRYYIKHYRLSGLWPLLQNLFRPCKALLEWTAAHRVKSLGLPTFEAVAVGRCYAGGVVCDNYLVSRAIDDAVPLDAFLTSTFRELPKPRQSRLRGRLAHAVGRLVAELHASGVRHRDLHAGNILLRLLPGDDVRLWIIDLHTAQFGPPPGWDTSRTNLAILNQFFVGRATRSDRRRFFASYWETRRTLSGDSPLPEGTERLTQRTRLREVEAFCQQEAVRHWRRSDRRWFRGNRHLIKLEGANVRCRGLAVLGRPLLEEIRDRPEDLFGAPVQFWCKTTGRHRVAAVTVPIAGKPLLCYWKRAESRGLAARLIRWGRMPRVRHAWEIGHAFLRRGIATARPLAFVDASRRTPSRQYLLTEGIPQSMTLARFLDEAFPRLEARDRRAWVQGVMRNLAEQVRAMHRFGFDHRDLKASNILVADDPAKTQTWILDLDAVRRWPWLPPSAPRRTWRALNVSSLLRPVVQNSDRLRFLLHYLGTRSKTAWKPLWRKIARRSGRKIQHNRRTGRPLT